MRYRLIGSDGSVRQEGTAVTEVAGGALVVSPPFGQVLRIAAADVLEIGEPEPYVVRLVLAGGGVLELRQLGAMRTQLLAELSDARATDVTATMLVDGVGRPEEFPGWCGGTPARLRLYDDALVVLPDTGEAEKVPYPFVRGVATDASGYRVTVEVAGRDSLELHRMASRTNEFVTLLGERHRAAAGRTAAFLGVLLPGLGPSALGTVAAMLPDGVAAARADLDRVDPGVWPALTAAATRPERVAALRLLEGAGAIWLGFTQVASVERPAQGGQAWRDHAVTPNLGDHGAPGGAWGSWFGAGFWGSAGFGGSWYGSQHRQLPRADVDRGRLTPAHTDVDALATDGPAPTVRAFALCLTPGGRLVYEALNEADHATYVFRAADPATVAGLNRALDQVGFRAEAVDADPVGSAHGRAADRMPAVRLLRAAYVGRVDHGDGWPDRLRSLLG